MRCSDALEAMLDADLEDLRPGGPSALATHLQSCAKCARVAATMRADVHALATVMPVLPSSASRPWVLWPGLAMASAAVALVVVLMNREPSTPMSGGMPRATTPIAVAPLTEPVQPRASAPAIHAKAEARSLASARYAMPEPLPIDGVADVGAPAQRAPTPELPFDGVSASSDGSVTVLKTSNPKITVIWFN